MPLAGNPPTYTRGYSFRAHSVAQPNVPQPGDKLDQEFDDVAAALSGSAGVLQRLVKADGSLRDGIVGLMQLTPGLFEEILDDAQDQLQPVIEAAREAAAAAMLWAQNGQAAAAAAAADAAVAAGAIADTASARVIALTAAAAAAQEAADAQDWAEEAENSANTSEAAMQQSLGWKEESFKWAEYMAGPVDPAPPGWPEAVDDGRWSSKWWANRAAEIIGDYGKWYVGAFPDAPPTPLPPWPPGSLYYDTDTGLMMVWDGTSWKPLTQPGPSVQFSFTYRAAAEQTGFSGPDVFGKTPVLNVATPPVSDVHVNGVRLVQGDATFGDYSVDTVGGVLHINTPLMVDSVVQWDLHVPPAQLQPHGVFAAHKLLPLTFDGVTRDFAIAYNEGAGNKPATTTGGVQLQIVLDGVLQEFGADYSAVGATLSFVQAPVVNTRFSGVWYQPGVA